MTRLLVHPFGAFRDFPARAGTIGTRDFFLEINKLCFGRVLEWMENLSSGHVASGLSGTFLIRRKFWQMKGWDARNVFFRCLFTCELFVMSPSSISQCNLVKLSVTYLLILDAIDCDTTCQRLLFKFHFLKCSKHIFNRVSFSRRSWKQSRCLVSGGECCGSKARKVRFSCFYMNVNLLCSALRVGSAHGGSKKSVPCSH